MLVVGGGTADVFSTFSPPVTFAMPGDGGLDSGCAVLRLEGHLSNYAFGTAAERPRRPAMLGGLDLLSGQALSYTLPDGTVTTAPYRTDEAFLLPPAMEIVHDDGCRDSAYGLSCTADIGCNVTACGGLSGQGRMDCLTQQFADMPVKRFPVVRLRALDVSGQAVPGLRVRLRSLQQLAFPDLPKVTEIISCGFLTPAEAAASASTSDDVTMLPEMDGGATHAASRSI